MTMSPNTIVSELCITPVFYLTNRAIGGGSSTENRRETACVARAQAWGLTAKLTRRFASKDRR